MKRAIVDVCCTAASLGLILLVTTCGHPAYAGGDESQNTVRRVRPHVTITDVDPGHPAPITLPQLKAALQAPPTVKRVPLCDDTRHLVLAGRDDLYKTGCYPVPSFGQSGENPSQSDVSPN
jgi:hypothetical protein